MFFPWVGMLEQIRLADTFVYYDDVQFSKGSFVNRVQVKASSGTKWLTIPLEDLHLGQKINEAIPHRIRPWRQAHLDLLANCYRDAPFSQAMLELVGDFFDRPMPNLADLTISSMETLAKFFSIEGGKRFYRSSELGIEGRSSERVLEIVRALGCSTYITGHGAARYLNHELFDEAGISVEYMRYEMRPYAQLHGDFTPYVSALDLLANMGKEGASMICSGSISWKEFLNT